MNFKKIAIGSDHAGKDLKQMVIEYLKVCEIEVIDHGVALDTNASVDYPDYAEAVASQVAKSNVDGGILICGTGIGMCITANKFPDVRAALTWDEYTTKMCRMHNNANVLCLGARTINHHRAIDLVKTFLESSYEGDRHQLRLGKITELEKKNFSELR